MNNKKICVLFLIIGSFFILFFSTNNYAAWSYNGNNYQYIDDKTGNTVKNSWLQSNNNYYYVDETGYMVKGWKYINQAWRFFDDNGIMQKGFVEYNNNTYYLKDDGSMITGWLKQNIDNTSKFYYFKSDGRRAKGWQLIDSLYYYFLDTGEAIVNEWAKIDNKWYHFSNDATLTLGWYIQNNNYYFLNANTGEMVTGWVQDNQGYSYYLDNNSGVMLRNTTITINGMVYTFGDDGKLTNTNNFSSQTAQNINNYNQSIINNSIITNGNNGFVVGEKPNANNTQNASHTMEENYGKSSVINTTKNQTSVNVVTGGGGTNDGSGNEIKQGSTNGPK